jgi:orotate phosphoribosyltransferase
MTQASLDAFHDLVGARHGHFRLESGLHSRLWLDLDALFADGERIEPLVLRLADAIRPYGVSVICGPLLGGAFLAQLLARALGVEFCYTERRPPAGPGGLFQARYELPPALVPRISGKRLALVDDVMSAGSALRATYAEVQARGGTCVVTGALLVLGSTGADYFAGQGVPVEAVLRHDFESWEPESCPLCAAGVALES